ncbi:MAG TPA: hypothetical protein VFD29_01055 [Gillisia sp.]|nr:hypothetical protein [Gillisia sp.]
MQGFKKIFKFYINASFHVALAVVCLTDITIQEFDVPRNYKLLLFIFSASITGYNFVKYAGIAKLHHLSLAKNLRQIQIFSLTALIGLVYLTFYQSISVLLFSGVLGLFTLLYALPLLVYNTSLRNLTGLKIFVIAFVWAGVTVLLPLTDHINVWKWDVFVVFLQRFFLVLALILPFEIRDLQFDLAQLRTIPQKFGVRGTRIVGLVLICLFVLLEFLKHQTSMANTISLIFVAILLMILIRYSTTSQSKYYASFWVESVPILWWLLYTLLMEIT